MGTSPGLELNGINHNLLRAGSDACASIGTPTSANCKVGTCRKSRQSCEVVDAASVSLWRSNLNAATGAVAETFQQCPRGESHPLHESSTHLGRPRNPTWGFAKLAGTRLSGKTGTFGPKVLDTLKDLATADPEAQLHSYQAINQISENLRQDQKGDE